MATSYTYPTAVELTEIEQDLAPRMMAGRVIFDLFPMEEVNSDLLIFEQKDNYSGLAQVRGLNGAAPRVIPVGYKRYQVEPGIYGEYIPVDEAELLKRASPASFTQFISVDDLVAERQEFLMQRQFDRQEQICWTLITTGTFSVPGPSGAVLHTDSYTTQTFTASVPWSTSATATPLADMRNAQLLGLGHGVSFGPDATAYMNQVTMNNLLANSNAADLYGRRTAGFGTFNGPKQISELFIGDNLPQVRVYEGGYFASASAAAAFQSGTTTAFTRFLPNGKVVIVGKRLSGAPVGAFRMTRNACNPNSGPGVWTFVQDYRQQGIVPPKLEVTRAFNGGPVLYYPSSVIVMSV